MNGAAAQRGSSGVGQAFEKTREFPGGLFGAEDAGARGASGRTRVGLVRQIVYVAIDVAMVCLCGVLVSWLNFDFENARGFTISPAEGFFAHVVAPVYPGFLLL
jgi:hypothetical protein